MVTPKHVPHYLDILKYYKLDGDNYLDRKINIAMALTFSIIDYKLTNECLPKPKEDDDHGYKDLYDSWIKLIKWSNSTY